jgi:hypothetical protein
MIDDRRNAQIFKWIAISCAVLFVMLVAALTGMTWVDVPGLAAVCTNATGSPQSMGQAQPQTTLASPRALRSYGMVSLVQQTTINNGRFLTVKGSNGQPAVTGGAMLDVTGINHNDSAANQRRRLLDDGSDRLEFLVEVGAGDPAGAAAQWRCLRASLLICTRPRGAVSNSTASGGIGRETRATQQLEARAVWCMLLSFALPEAGVMHAPAALSLAPLPQVPKGIMEQACLMHGNGHDTIHTHEQANGTTFVSKLEIFEASGCEFINSDLSKVRGLGSVSAARHELSPEHAHAPSAPLLSTARLLGLTIKTDWQRQAARLLPTRLWLIRSSQSRLSQLTEALTAAGQLQVRGAGLLDDYVDVVVVCGKASCTLFYDKQSDSLVSNSTAAGGRRRLLNHCGGNAHKQSFLYRETDQSECGGPAKRCFSSDSTVQVGSLLADAHQLWPWVPEEDGFQLLAEQPGLRHRQVIPWQQELHAASITPPAACNRRVQVMGKGTVQMAGLAYGDKVLAVERSSGALVWREVYLFGHRDHEVVHPYLNVRTGSGHVLQVGERERVGARAAKALCPSSVTALGVKVSALLAPLAWELNCNISL